MLKGKWLQIENGKLSSLITGVFHSCLFCHQPSPPPLYTQLIPLLSSYFIIALVNNVLKNIFRFCSICIWFVCDILHTWCVKDCASRWRSSVSIRWCFLDLPGINTHILAISIFRWLTLPSYRINALTQHRASYLSKINPPYSNQEPFLRSVFHDIFS